MTDPTDDRPPPDEADEGEVLNAAIRTAGRHRLEPEFFNPPPDGNTAA